MRKINLFSSNKDRAVLMTLIVVIFAFITIAIPFIFVTYIPQSIIGSYLGVNTSRQASNVLPTT